jgi:hypothetical protein
MKTPQEWTLEFINSNITRGQVDYAALDSFIARVQSDVLKATEQSTRDLLECRSTVNELETQLNFWKSKAIELGYPV